MPKTTKTGKTTVEKNTGTKKILTQEDLDQNPELVDQGLKVGDEITIPAPDAKSLKPPKAKKTVPEGCFAYDGKTYRIVLPKVKIPGLGSRTALEILADEDAQAYLVKENCIGSVITEVID